MGELADLWRRVRSRHDDDRGASLVEYALLLALIAVVCVAAVSYLGHAASTSYSKDGSCVAQAGDVNATFTGCP